MVSLGAAGFNGLYEARRRAPRGPPACAGTPVGACSFPLAAVPVLRGRGGGGRALPRIITRRLGDLPKRRPVDPPRALAVPPRGSVGSRPQRPIRLSADHRTPRLPTRGATGPGRTGA